MSRFELNYLIWVEFVRKVLIYIWLIFFTNIASDNFVNMCWSICLYKWKWYIQVPFGPGIWIQYTPSWIGKVDEFFLLFHAFCDSWRCFHVFWSKVNSNITLYCICSNHIRFCSMHCMNITSFTKVNTLFKTL